MFAGRLQNYDDPRSLGSRLRLRRLRPFLDMVDAVWRERGGCRILDLGGRRGYWRIVPETFFTQRNCVVVVSNLEEREAGPPSEVFSEVTEDATRLPHADRSFDLVHSNSVIEHVGGWREMRAFAEGAARVGRGYFVQTPDYWFPLEPHFGTPFFAQLPRPLQVRLLMRRGRGFFPRAASVEEAVRSLETVQLLSRPMMAALFPDARIGTERVLGLSKSLIAVRRPD